MKKIAWNALICVLAFSSCTKSITGEGPVVTENRTVTNFTGVQLEGSGAVEIEQGAIQSVTISGYSNLVPIYTSTVKNNTLVLKFDEAYKNIRNSNIKTKIVVADISNVEIHGSGDILVKGFVANGNLRSEINGSGKIRITNTILTTLDSKINGSGDIDAIGANSAEVKAEINGSGYIGVTCSQKLTAKISGSGTIDYWGSPTVNTDISGSGKVRKQ